MRAIPQQSIHCGAYACVFNQGRFARAQVRELLANDGARLFAGRECVCTKGNGVSCRIPLDGRPAFLKEFVRVRRSASVLYDLVSPPRCFRIFWSARRLLRLGLPAPEPLLAVVLHGAEAPREVYVQEYRDACRDLPDSLDRANDRQRGDILLALATLLCDLQRRQCRAPGIRARHVLTCDHDDGGLCLSELDDLCRDRLPSTETLPRTLGRIAGDLGARLTSSDLGYLMQRTFDLALKHNLYRDTGAFTAFRRIALEHYHRLAAPA